MRIYLLLAVCVLSIPFAPRLAAEQQQPNVLLFLVDDLGKHDLTVEGSEFYQTPNIDRLAEQSFRFSQGYATCQVCSPSRASIQLGKFPARHGITDYIGAKSGTDWDRNDKLLPAEYLKHLPHEDVTLAEALQENGYQTFYAGKWHLGGDGSLPTDHGYEINRGGFHAGSPPGGFFAPFENPQLENGPPGESLTLRLGEETADFIKGEHEHPFFAMLAFYTVHAPVQTTHELWSKYQQRAPDPSQTGQRFRIDRTLPVRQIQDHPVYAGMVETLDNAVGNVLDALDQAGLADSTVVIFTSDNGGVSSGDAYATCNLPLRGGKGRQWEGGIREPFYIKLPHLEANTQSIDVPVTGADLYPTILDVCGLPLRNEQHVDGVSLLPLMQGESIEPRQLVWHYPHYGNQGGEPSSILRDGDYKLIHYYEDGSNELYNVAKDVPEQNDLAEREPDRVASMLNQLQAWLESVGAKYPQPDPRYNAQAAAAKWQRIHTAKKAQLERQHAAMLEPDWQPNPTWWGSQPASSN